MNWINKFFLTLVLLPSKLYRLWGINVEHLTSILTVKLIMDDRRPNTIQATRQQQHSEKEISNATLGTMLMSVVMGLVYLTTFVFGSEYVTQFTLYFTLFITFLCMTLVSDFTAVLIDVRDTYIILPKPVTDKTFVTARLLHIFIHICKLVIPMTLPAFVYLLIKNHLGASFIFLLVALFATLFAIFIINAVYIIILRITTPERFKNIISYIQIAFAILIYGSYQLLPRMMDDMEMESFEIGHNGWLALFPPYWFACAFNSLLTWQAEPVQWLATALAFIVPLASIYVVVKYLAPAFNQKLAMISGSAEGPGAASGNAPGTQEKKGFAEILASLLTTNKTERTGFLFTWKMMSRSRDFKVRVYPSIGYFIVLLVMLFIKNGDGNDDKIDFGNSFKPLMAVYLSTVILLVAITHMLYSEKHKAAWMFFVTPVRLPGEIISGALKATIFQFYFFIALVIMLIGISLAGFGILPNLLLALCNQLLINYAIAVIGYKQLPFSQPAGNAMKGGQLMRGSFMLLISAFVGAIHFFVFRNQAAIIIAFLVSATVLGLLMYRIRKITWQALPAID